MPFAPEKQLRLFGPQLFEDFCHKLVSPPDGPAYHVEGKGGDEGIDIFLGPLDPAERKRTGAPLHVWQVKCFPDGVRAAQKTQIRESLKRVLDAHNPTEWTLCIPVTLDVPAHKWWEELKAEYPAVRMTLLDGGELVKLALRPEHASLLKSYFIVPPDAVDTDRILARLNDFDDVHALLRAAEESPKPRTDFYDGSVPDWDDILHERDATRDKTAELWRFVQDRALNPGGRVPFALLTGRSGEGKTTVLKRLAASLAQSGAVHVLYHKSDAATLSADQFMEIAGNPPVFIIIDRVTRFDAYALTGFLDRLRSCPIRPVVIAAAITSHWRALGCDPENVADFHTVEIEGMTPADIEALLDRLSEDPGRADEYLGKLAGLSREEQVAVFRKKAKGQLLVALLESKYGGHFKTFITEELRELTRRCGTTVRLACNYVSALHRLDLPMPKALLARLLPPHTDLDLDILNNTEGLVGLIADEDNIVTRHPSVAQIIYAAGTSPERWYERIIATAETEDEQLLLGAMIHAIRMLGDTSLAMKLVSVASARFPGNSTFPLLHAMTARATGDTDTARQKYLDAAGLDPTSPDAWLDWATMEQDVPNIGAVADPEEYTARWLFRRAAEVAPNMLYAWLMWAVMESGQPDIGELDQPAEYTARWLFRMAASVDETRASLWQAWGSMEVAHGNAGDLDAPGELTARWCFRKAAAIDPRDVFTWQAWAKVESDQSNIGEVYQPSENTARWLYRRAVEMDPSEVLTYQLWATMEEERGNIGDLKVPMEFTARWLFHRAVVLEPNNPLSLRGWARMELRQGNWSKAERIMLRLLRVVDDPSLRCKVFSDLAFACSMLGVHVQALMYRESAVKVAPENSRAHAWLGKVYGQARRWKGAEKHFRIALDLNPDDEETKQWYIEMVLAKHRLEGGSADTGPG